MLLYCTWGTVLSSCVHVTCATGRSVSVQLAEPPQFLSCQHVVHIVSATNLPVVFLLFGVMVVVVRDVDLAVCTVRPAACKQIT